MQSFPRSSSALFRHTRFGALLAVTLVVFALVGCSKKEETGAGPPAPGASPSGLAPTPIDPFTVGEVAGKVTFDGAIPKPQKIMMDQDPFCVQKHNGVPVFAEDGRVNDDRTVPNVFVYVKSGAEKYSFAPPAEPVVLDQNGCLYQPHVLGIMAGQTLKITSGDATIHNIHAIPRDNRQWNMSQAPGAAPIEQKFTRPEIMIPVKCNQHPWMRAWIGVTSNPFFAVSGSDGAFDIKGLPPGNYTIEAWAFLGGAAQIQDQEITIRPKESKSIEFTFKTP